MKKTIPFLYALLAAFGAAAQAPGIQWEKTLGGTKDEEILYAAPVSGGAYVLCGNSNSGVSGNKTEPGNGSYDYWVIQLDATGQPVWQKCFGGAGSDRLSDAKKTTDGGFILAGTSSSQPSGNKTEPNYGGTDYWIVKLDSTGDIQWQKTLGGSTGERLYCVIQTADEGFMVGGYSYSNISGNKTEDTRGGWDYWVVKLNASGDIQWQKDLGGVDYETLESVCQAPDGGYLLGGHTDSGASGDKTEAGMGGEDIWIVKLDASGALQWQNAIGGSDSDFVSYVGNAVDGGYVLGGWTGTTNVSGDKTEAGLGAGDLWLLKLDNTGQIVWQNTVGGNKDDFLFEFKATPDGNYLMAGWSRSDASGDKTEASRGGGDFWVVKFDANCQIIWQKSMGGAWDEGLKSATPTPDHGWILTGYSASPASGDKSENTLGEYDGWVVKLNPEPALSVSERPVLAQVSCRPHPFSDAFSLALERPAENDFTLRIFDLSGKCTGRFEWPAGNQTLDLSAQHWLPGNYIAEARGSNGALIFSTVLQKR